MSEKKAVAKKDDKLSPVEHVYVPKQTLLSEKEKDEILKRYKITVQELPKIRISDPGIKHLGAKPGDIVKIERKSISAGDSVFYRGVVSD